MKKRRPPWQQKDQSGKPIEPPLANDKRQFIAAVMLRAARSGKPYNPVEAMKRAKIDWKRRRRVERSRQARTESIEDMLAEPSVPGFLPTLMTEDRVRYLMEPLIDQERAVITLQILLGFTRQEAATILGITNRAVQLTRTRALNRLRTLLSEECFPSSTTFGRVQRFF